MSVVIKNLQKSTVLNLWQVRKDLFILRNIMGLQSFDIGLIFVSNRKMKEMNGKYRTIFEPTDILSFPFHQMHHDKLQHLVHNEDRDLGDIFVCPQVVKSKYEVEEYDLRKVLVPLLTHGLCHLCGYVHETDEQHKRMNEKEKEILDLFSKRVGKPFEPL